MYKGLFIALEGGEGAGKSTMAQLLKEKLQQQGKEVIITREPGGIPSAEAIRNNIMDFYVDSKTELLLYLSARREHLVNKIIPCLEEGKIVITDRFYLSSLVYQGHARGLGIDRVRELNSFVCENVYPDLNILLDIPPEIGLLRKAEAKDLNRLDLESKEFHQKVNEGYKILVKQNQDKIVVIDATKNIDEILNTIISYLDRV
ncbi:MAG: dTMP kinase [Epulopiscium sp. Nele67-Bin004]|nr:MAG: dTMP kinase [Epulopiscium sp. Nele67-Bin004]